MYNGVLRQITYFLKKPILVECNYIIYNKKLLAIVKNFEIWCPELHSTINQVKIYTNHRNLRCFIVTEQLNWQQTRWAKFLFKFNFKIMYKPGKQGGKPNVLMQISQDIPKKVKNLRQQHQFQTLLHNNQSDKNVKKS